MNLYKLNPGEKEKHIHDTESTSTLLNGQATMEYGNVQMKMVIGEPISIPSNIWHEMKNTGQETCQIACICT